ncbi:MAG: hypothetical protein P4L51_27415 [Puia sp.]|nr:hypothetical protein [Puia sp.]
MKRKFQWLFPSSNYDAVPVAIGGFLIIYALTRHSGIGVSPDSIVYMSSAANFVEHGVLKDYQNVPIADFPCFYPLFLSGLLFITRLKVMDFAPVLNGLLFALLIYGWGWVMERFRVCSKIYKWILLVIIATSPCLLEVYSMLWSETLFMLWILLLMPALRHYGRARSTGSVLVVGLITAMACITRYAGITLAGTAGLFILLGGSLKPLKKIAHLFLFGLVSASLLTLNLIRNNLVNGTLTGWREKGITSFGQNLHDLGSVFCDWLPFFNGRYAGAAALAVCWFGLLAFLFVRRLVRWFAASPPLPAVEPDTIGFWSYENMATVFFIVYFLFILLSATFSRFQTLNSRLLSPLFIPWVLGASSWVPSLFRQLATGRRRRWRIPALIAALLAAGCFLWGQKQTDAETWDGVKDAGIPGYTEDPWRNSETVKYIRDNKTFFENFSKRYTLYSNANDAVWFLLGGLHADMLPHKDFKNDIAEFLAEKTFYVFWFNDASNPDLLTIPFISSHVRMVEEHHFEDGAVYKFSAP